MWLENLLHTERTSSKNIGNAILKKFKESKDKGNNESLNVREESEILSLGVTSIRRRSL